MWCGILLLRLELMEPADRKDSRPADSMREGPPELLPGPFWDRKRLAALDTRPCMCVHSNTSEDGGNMCGLVACQGWGQARYLRT